MKNSIYMLHYYTKHTFNEFAKKFKKSISFKKCCLRLLLNRVSCFPKRKKKPL